MVNSNIITETGILEMETKFKETQSSITEILKLLTTGWVANPPVDVTLVPAYPIGGAEK